MRVERAAVHDANAAHAFEQRRAARGQLCDHSRGGGAARNHRVDPGAIEHGDRLASSVEHAGGAARDYQVRFTQRRGDATRHDVGIHVQNERFACSAGNLANAQTGHDRHVPVHQQQLDKRRVRLGRIADQSKIDDRPRRGSMRGRTGRTAQSGVDTRQSNGRHARRDERGDQLGVGRAGKHRDHHVERRAVGDAQAIDLPRRDGAAIELRVDGPASAVHNDQRPMQRNGRRQRRNPRAIGGRFKQLAAELQHQRPVHSSPTRSSTPNATLKFCSACPAAPFTRLSRHDTMTSRRVAASKRQPISQKLVHATCLISGSASPVSLMNGSSRKASS
jgi:hypothetical protein